MMKLPALFLSALLLLTLCGQAQGREHDAKHDGEGSAPVASSADSAYVIAPSDLLTVTVWNQPAVSGERLVRPDGKISMPLLGDVQGAGYKPMELAGQLTGMLKKFMIDPQVSVTVSQVHHNYVYMLGEVGKVGPVDLTEGMTLLEAISTAGGVSDYAKKSKIYILRKVDGKEQRIPVNYKRALKGDAAFNLALSAGDTIVVP